MRGPNCSYAFCQKNIITFGFNSFYSAYMLPCSYASFLLKTRERDSCIMNYGKVSHMLWQSLKRLLRIYMFMRTEPRAFSFPSNAACRDHQKMDVYKDEAQDVSQVGSRGTQPLKEAVAVRHAWNADWPGCSWWTGWLAAERLWQSISVQVSCKRVKPMDLSNPCNIKSLCLAVSVGEGPVRPQRNLLGWSVSPDPWCLPSSFSTCLWLLVSQAHQHLLLLVKCSP